MKNQKKDYSPQLPKANFLSFKGVVIALLSLALPCCVLAGEIAPEAEETKEAQDSKDMGDLDVLDTEPAKAVEGSEEEDFEKLEANWAPEEVLILEAESQQYAAPTPGSEESADDKQEILPSPEVGQKRQGKPALPKLPNFPVQMPPEVEAYFESFKNQE